MRLARDRGGRGEGGRGGAGTGPAQPSPAPTPETAIGLDAAGLLAPGSSSGEPSRAPRIGFPSGDLAVVPGYSGGGRAGIAPASLLSGASVAEVRRGARQLLELVEPFVQARSGGDRSKPQATSSRVRSLGSPHGLAEGSSGAVGGARRVLVGGHAGGWGGETMRRGPRLGSEEFEALAIRSVFRYSLA
jgi:hypothetical protein